jgi:hypothetical protein
MGRRVRRVYPAVILVNARTELTARIERKLFEEGFEVIVVGGESGASVSPRAAWSALHAAGLVVIYQNPSLGSEERLELKAVADERFFDHLELKLPAGHCRRA